MHFAKLLHMVRIILFSVFLIAGCASAPATRTQVENGPAWINKPESAYSADRYLVSVGQGSSRELAIQDAKKSMAESFVVKVQSVTESKTNSIFNQNSDGAASGESREDTRKDVSMRTDTYLRGVEVKEVFEQGSTTFALVALDKLKARSGLLMESNRIKKELENTLNSLEEKFTQVKLDRAQSKFAEFATLYGEASALGMSTLVEISPLEARLNRIESAVRNKNQKLSFHVKTTQGETYFERDIESCINDRGGTLSNVEPSNKIEIAVIERPQHLPIEGWTRIRFDLTAAIVQTNGKKYRIQTTKTETGRSRNAVLESVSDQLSEDLCNQLFSRINEMTTN